VVEKAENMGSDMVKNGHSWRLRRVLDSRKSLL
jgi:hypothetical protein